MNRSNRSTRSTRSICLELEQLEDRLVPTPISVNSTLVVTNNGTTLTLSDLTIAGGQSNLQVVQQPNTGRFLITDSGKNFGPYAATNIVINGNNASNFIAVTLDNTLGHGVLPGSLTINGGNSPNFISVDGTNGSEAIDGTLTITGGNSNDYITVGTNEGRTLQGTTQLSGGLGNDTVVLGNNTGSPVTFVGNLNLHSFQTMPLSVLGSSTVPLIGGLRIDEQLNANTTTIKPFPLNVSLSNATIRGALSIYGDIDNDTVTLGNDALGSLVTNLGPTYGNDSVTVTGTTVTGSVGITFGGVASKIAPVPSLSLGSDTIGSLVVNLGNGNASVGLTSLTVRGGTALTFGNGNDSVSIDAASVFNSSKAAGNSFSLSMGNGVNFYDLSSAFTVWGNMTITSPATGTVGQNIALGAIINPSLAGSDGNLTVRLGNGDDTFTVLSTAYFGALNYTSGNGNDSVTINVPTTNTAAHNLAIVFGGPGMDTLTLNGGGAILSSVSINWGDTLMGDDLFTNNLSAAYTVTYVGASQP